MNFIETFFIEDLTLCDDIIEYFKNLPPNKKFEGRIGLSNSHIDYSKKRSIETIFEWNENGKKTIEGEFIFGVLASKMNWGKD